MSLDLTAGYTSFLAIFKGISSGPGATAALDLTWGKKHKHGGFRFTGSFYQVSGQDTEIITNMVGGGFGVVGEYKGLWGSTGLGVWYGSNDDDRGILPEMYSTLGYRLRLGDHLAVQVSGELATFFLVAWRASLSAGLTYRF